VQHREAEEEGERQRRKMLIAHVRPNQSAVSSSSVLNMGMPVGVSGPKTRFGTVQKARTKGT
jgi:hypothetical protein